MYRTLIPLIALAALAGGWPAAGEEPAAEFGELIEVSEVLLDVLVTDRQGHVILGLGPDDFVVREDGEPIPVTSVSFYSNRFRLPDEEDGTVFHPLPNEVLADRYFIFFFHKRSGHLLEAIRQCRRWVEEELLPGDWVAVVSYDFKLKVHEDFTGDRTALLRAFEEAARSQDPENVWLTRRGVPEDQPSLVRNLPAGRQLRRETAKVYDALRLVAEASGEIMGRKNLIFFSPGLPLPTGTIGMRDRRYYPGLIRALNDNNVAVYPVAPMAAGHTLNQLAADTGGHYHGHFVNFINPLRRIADEVNGYYLLSYQAEHPVGEHGYRKVKVEVRNPEFVVRARKGYRYGA